MEQLNSHFDIIAIKTSKNLGQKSHSKINFLKKVLSKT